MHENARFRLQVAVADRRQAATQERNQKTNIPVIRGWLLSSALVADSRAFE
jgi:hypothetical protein